MIYIISGIAYGDIAEVMKAGGYDRGHAATLIRKKLVKLPRHKTIRKDSGQKAHIWPLESIQPAIETYKASRKKRGRKNEHQTMVGTPQAYA